MIWLLSVCRGRVIGPTFHFDVTELNLGDVAFGEVHEALSISSPVGQPYRPKQNKIIRLMQDQCYSHLDLYFNWLLQTFITNKDTADHRCP